MLENICMVLIILVAIFAIGGAIIKFAVLDSEAQQKKIKLVLLDLVLMAESALGSKTGRAKRAQVYKMLTDKMPWLIFFMSEGQYDQLLDATLEEMKGLLNSNTNLAEAYNIK